MWCVLTSTPFSFFSIMSPIPECFIPCTTYCWHKRKWGQQKKLWFILGKKKSTQYSLKFFQFLTSFCLSFSWINYFPILICFVLWFSFFWTCNLPFSLAFPSCLFSQSQPSTFSCQLHCIQEKGTNKFCSHLDEKQPLSFHTLPFYALAILDPHTTVKGKSS